MLAQQPPGLLGQVEVRVDALAVGQLHGRVQLGQRAVIIDVVAQERVGPEHVVETLDLMEEAVELLALALLRKALDRALLQSCMWGGRQSLAFWRCRALTPLSQVGRGGAASAAGVREMAAEPRKNVTDTAVCGASSRRHAGACALLRTGIG